MTIRMLRATTWRIDERLLEGLEELRRRDGVPVSEAVRRAIEAWLQAKGIELPAPQQAQIVGSVASVAGHVRVKRARKKPERRREQARKRS